MLSDPVCEECGNHSCDCYVTLPVFGMVPPEQELSNVSIASFEGPPNRFLILDGLAVELRCNIIENRYEMRIKANSDPYLGTTPDGVTYENIGGIAMPSKTARKRVTQVPKTSDNPVHNPLAHPQGTDIQQPRGNGMLADNSGPNRSLADRMRDRDVENLERSARDWIRYNTHVKPK